RFRPRSRRRTGGKVGTFVEDSATQSWGERSICSPAYFFNGVLTMAAENRIDTCFRELRARREAALVPFLTAGDPDLGATLELLRAAARAGADLIQLGFPFSAPTADGPAIQRSSARAIERGISLPMIFEVVAEFRRSSDVPIVLFGYYRSEERRVGKWCRSQWAAA